MTVRLVQPLARSCPRVSGRRGGSTDGDGTGGERTTGPPERQTVVGIGDRGDRNVAWLAGNVLTDMTEARTLRPPELRRARRRWHPIPGDLLDRLRETGLVVRVDRERTFVETHRSLPDRLLAVRTDERRGQVAQAGWPSIIGRSPTYLVLADTVQVEIDKILYRLVRKQDTASFVEKLDELAQYLESEDQKAVEAERAARGGRLPERKERRVSVRAVSGGLPSLGKRRG